MITGGGLNRKCANAPSVLCVDPRAARLPSQVACCSATRKILSNVPGSGFLVSHASGAVPHASGTATGTQAANVPMARLSPVAKMPTGGCRPAAGPMARLSPHAPSPTLATLVHYTPPRLSPCAFPSCPAVPMCLSLLPGCPHVPFPPARLSPCAFPSCPAVPMCLSLLPGCPHVPFPPARLSQCAFPKLGNSSRSTGPTMSGPGLQAPCTPDTVSATEDAFPGKLVVTPMEIDPRPRRESAFPNISPRLTWSHAPRAPAPPLSSLRRSGAGSYPLRRWPPIWSRTWQARGT